jgi:RNA polymerase sigma-32 factor
MISSEEQKKLALECQKIYKETGAFPKKQMEKLYLSILPFLHKYTYKKSVKTNGQSKDDLMQVAYEALCKGVENYNPNKMDNFFNYIIPWVVAYVRAENIRHISMFRFGTRKDRKMFNKISQCSDMSREDQAKFLGIPLNDLDFFTQAIKIPKTLLKKKNADDADFEGEEYLSTGSLNPEQFLEFKEVFLQITDIFNDFEKELTERELEIFNLMRKVGTPEKGNFAEKNEDTYEALAQKFGVTRERIRQIAGSIKDRLRKRLTKNGIDSKGYHLWI